MNARKKRLLLIGNGLLSTMLLAVIMQLTPAWVLSWYLVYISVIWLYDEHWSADWVIEVTWKWRRFRHVSPRYSYHRHTLFEAVYIGPLEISINCPNLYPPESLTWPKREFGDDNAG